MPAVRTVQPEAGDLTPSVEARILLSLGDVMENSRNWWPVVVGLSGLLALLVSVPV